MQESDKNASGGTASHHSEQLAPQPGSSGGQLGDPLMSDEIIQIKAKISSAKRVISQNINKTEEVAQKIRNLINKGENEVNSEFIRGEIHFAIALMKEADIHRTTVSKATAELIEKCEIISLKNESSNPDLANRATVLVNKATQKTKITVGN